LDHVYTLADMLTKWFHQTRNRELLFRLHNAIDLRIGQQERFKAFRPAPDILIPSASDR